MSYRARVNRIKKMVGLNIQARSDVLKFLELFYKSTLITLEISMNNPEAAHLIITSQTYTLLRPYLYSTISKDNMWPARDFNRKGSKMVKAANAHHEFVLMQAKENGIEKFAINGR